MMEHLPGLNPAATDPLPFFMPAPGATDGLYVFTVIFLILMIFGVGVLYLKLHALPEHMAHGGSKLQFQIVGVLALLALFTHNHIYWVAALLLALIQFPDFSTPLNSISRSLEKLAGLEPPPDESAEAGSEAPGEAVAPHAHDQRT
jgi:hypothetical protein